MQKWCSHRLVLCTCGFSALALGYYHNETENSEAKPSKMHIDYVKDVAVDTWIMSGNSEDDE